MRSPTPLDARFRGRPFRASRSDTAPASSHERLRRSDLASPYRGSADPVDDRVSLALVTCALRQPRCMRDGFGVQPWHGRAVSSEFRCLFDWMRRVAHPRRGADLRAERRGSWESWGTSSISAVTTSFERRGFPVTSPERTWCDLAVGSPSVNSWPSAISSLRETVRSRRGIDCGAIVQQMVRSTRRCAARVGTGPSERAGGVAARNRFSG